jgi:hypothetical protein
MATDDLGCSRSKIVNKSGLREGGIYGRMEISLVPKRTLSHPGRLVHPQAVFFSDVRETKKR